MKQESVAVGRKSERHVEGFRIAYRLLHSAANRVGIILGFDYREGEVRAVVQKVVRPLFLSSCGDRAAYDDATGREAVLAPYLRILIPPGFFQRRGDVPIAYLCFAQGFLARQGAPV